jgi:hypothetical protein
MEIAVTDPSIAVVYFFSGEEQAQALFEQLAASQELRLQKLLEQESLVVYGNDEKNYWLDWVRLENVIIVRLILSEEGPGRVSSWRDLRELVDATTSKIHSQFGRDVLLGTSLLYWGSADPEVIDNLASNYIVESLAIRQDSLLGPYQLEYGRMWKLKPREEYLGVAEYAFLCLLPLVEKGKREFLLSRNSGFLRLELHRHRAHGQIASYDKIRKPMLNLAAELERDSAALLDILEAKDLDVREQALRRASASYGKLMKMMSEARKLAAGLRADVERYSAHLESILGKGAYGIEVFLRQFRLRMRQIELDMDYCDATAKGVETSINILRAQLETDSARREGLIVIAIAALAAIIAVAQVISELTSDWRVVAGAMGIAIAACLIGWLAWRFFKRRKRWR